jgi:hypothetical protein
MRGLAVVAVPAASMLWRGGQDLDHAGFATRPRAFAASLAGALGD